MILTPDEAANLLQLDPFYQSRGQNPNLDATRAELIGSKTYGTKFGEITENAVTVNANNTQIQGSGNNGQTTYTASISNSYSNTTAISGGYSVAYFYSFGLSGDYKTDAKGTTEITTQSVYSNSTAVSNTLVTQASVTLDDVSNQTVGSGGSVKCPTCHSPLPQKPSVNIFLDKMFGGFMFQDPVSQGISANPVRYHDSGLRPGSNGPGPGAAGAAILGCLQQSRGEGRHRRNGTFEPDQRIRGWHVSSR